MSGICGICERGREWGARNLAPMLDALALPGELGRLEWLGRSIAFGVAKRWDFQQEAHLDGVAVAADADLVDLDCVAQALSIPIGDAASAPVAALIARLYRRRGFDFLNLLHGGFSLALWDEKAQQLMLAIDRIGIKSLYWRREGDRLLFASRIRAIRAIQQEPVDANPTAILQFLLFSAVPAPNSSDQGTEKLRPGTFLTFQSGNLAEHQYWDLEYPESDNRSVLHWSSKLR